MIGLLRSEWIKVRSTLSPFVLYGLAILLAVALASLMGNFVSSTNGDETAGNSGVSLGSPLMAMVGITPITLNLVWIAAIVSVTGEIRFGTNKLGFLASPKRLPAILAKTVLTVALSMLVTAVAVGLSLLVGGAISGIDSWTPFSGEGLRYLWRFPVVAGLGTLIAAGLAYLMRNAAGTISMLLVWVLAVENFIALIPSVGTKIQGWMPFLNSQYWAQGDIAKGAVTWSEPAALGWFALVSVVVFAAGALLTLRRDA